MMTASSTAFISSLFDQTGDFIQDLFPLLMVALGMVVALIAYKIIVNSFRRPLRRLFK